MLSDELCLFLPWDSEFFECRVARVLPSSLDQAQAQAIDKWCVDKHIDCIYFMATSNHPDTVRVAGDFGYRQLDVRIVYNHSLKGEILPSSLQINQIVDTATTEDLPALLEMIDNSFIHTRFYYDTQFDNARVNEMYKIWLVKSVEEKMADHVFVIKQDNVPLGFITCLLNHNTGTGSIGLVGVAASARGQQIATKLIYEAFRYFADEQITQVEVVTQARNISANRLYQKCGFRTSEVYLWYHKWFTNLSDG